MKQVHHNSSWTEADDYHIRTHYPDKRVPIADIARMLGRTEYAVKSRAGVMGIKRLPKKLRVGSVKRTVVPEEMTEYIKQLDLKFNSQTVELTPAVVEVTPVAEPEPVADTLEDWSDTQTREAPKQLTVPLHELRDAMITLSTFLDFWAGERCDEYEAGCYTCELWDGYDTLRMAYLDAVQADALENM